MHFYQRAPEHIIKECFELVRENLKPMYEETIGWDEESKLKEMSNPNMHFLVAFVGESVISGFCSFTEEFDTEVKDRWIIYCYEIQVKNQYRGQKLGTTLMNYLEDRARNLNASKIMLTCFCQNQPALSFYSKKEYKIDETSPTCSNVPYRILSLKFG
jgi:ribosomal protein S18 acetylase RimI-like enzyme